MVQVKFLVSLLSLISVTVKATSDVISRTEYLLLISLTALFSAILFRLTVLLLHVILSE